MGWQVDVTVNNMQLNKNMALKLQAVYPCDCEEQRVANTIIHLYPCR